MKNKIVYYIRNFIFINSQRRKLYKKGTLLNEIRRKKIIFIHIPKTAGVSLIRTIYGNVSLESHRSVSFYKRIFRGKYSEYFTFSFVRNPWDRLYSAYKFLEKGGYNIHDKNAFDMYFSEYQDFNDFVMNGLSNRVIYKVMHLIPQSDFICDRNDSILVDFVGRFEIMDQSVLDLENAIGTKINLEYHNMNQKKNYKEVYTEEMILKVNEIYKRDIDIFAYKFK